ncbi:MAG TPA: hypothetical protein VFE60_00390 [Roseiarcus sp.]|jgi:hypothetical protein|nr:hypothetical protein [Roseiarcus sp.]
MFVGTAKIYLGSHEEAIVWLRRSIEANRNNPLSHVFLAAASAAARHASLAYAFDDSVAACKIDLIFAELRKEDFEAG